MAADTARVIDVQAHILPSSYIDALRTIASGSDRAAGIAARALASPLTMKDPVFTHDLDERLRLMDLAGVDMQILEFPAPNVWSDDVDVRRRATESFNDGVADIVRDHRQRFAFSASLPVPFVDAAIAECERALDQLGAVAVTLCTHIEDVPIDDRRLDPLYEYLSNRGCTVLLHPEGFSIKNALADHGMEWALGAPFDDTIAAVRLIYGGVLDRFPGINWVVPHLGGVLPFLAKRLDFVWRLTPDVRKLLPTQPSDYLGRLWFDTANPDPRALRLACDVLGAERFMYASDFPFAQRQALQPGLAALGALDVGPSVRAGMKGQTARRLFGL